jgi:hypothetical protein
MVLWNGGKLGCRINAGKDGHEIIHPIRLKRFIVSYTTTFSQR